ncbi:PREDICTED: inter-alpha-trypsin inhibitor heavy chain H3-like, partial [Cyprinodon variegatus]|uniref:inter-alpha-trypsin inhibitor heavy chain H3-like n=1 Tax=Cyprinodon variegatus TaxID=28743 RepID=UPI000742631E
SVGRTMEEFKTSVTVAAHKKITFELTYEELLKRTHGKYELLIHAQPMQPVKDFKVDVYIHEKAGISYIGVKGGLSTKALANAITKTLADKQAWVYFYPTEDQQRACDSCGEQGMNGDLVISYDVNRDNGLGDIKTSDGYFVHHFAPSNLARIPKNVVFVIDKSGSMSGRKIQQSVISCVIIGVTNIEIIQTNVRQAIAGAFPLYCLGFGFDVNFEFLEKMSLENSGVARRIYEDSDADLQLKGFYEEVATPLLKDVIMVYAGATNLTQTNFSQYYNGSELVVAGELIDNNIETFVPQVVAISSNRKVIFSQKNDSVDTSTGTVTGGLLQRVWAYLTVKQLLEKEPGSKNSKPNALSRVFEVDRDSLSGAEESVLPESLRCARDCGSLPSVSHIAMNFVKGLPFSDGNIVIPTIIL